MINALKAPLTLGLLAGAVAGYSLATLTHSPAEPTIATADRSEAGAVEMMKTPSGRIAKLERELQEERHASEGLRSLVDRLESTMAAPGTTTAEPLASDSPVGSDWIDAAWVDLTADEETEDRRQMLLDAGFAPARADWLLDRKEELRMAALEARHAAPGAEPIDELQIAISARQSLREEIGDLEYERYLHATDQSTAVAVNRIVEGSQAQSAGFQIGDEIVDYAGTRVFNVIELSDQVRRGMQGEAVIVNVLRNGMPVQFVLPRGPLGIAGGKPPKH